MSRGLLSSPTLRHVTSRAAARARNQTYHQARRAARVDNVISAAQRDRARLAAQRAATWNRMRRCTPMAVGSWARVERELGHRLTPTSRDVLGLVRRAVQRGNSGIQLTIGQIGHKLGRCAKSVERSVMLLERLELVVRVPQFEAAPAGWSSRDGSPRHQRQVANVIVLGPAGKAFAEPARACRGRVRRPLSPPDKLSPPKTSDHTSYDADDRVARGRRTGTAKRFADLVTHRPEGKVPAPVSPARSGDPVAPPPPPPSRVTRSSGAAAPEEGRAAPRDALASFAALCPGLSAALGVSVEDGGGGPPSAPAGSRDAVTRDGHVTPGATP